MSADDRHEALLDAAQVALDRIAEAVSDFAAALRAAVGTTGIIESPVSIDQAAARAFRERWDAAAVKARPFLPGEAPPPPTFVRLDPASFVDLGTVDAPTPFPASGGGTVCPVPGCEIDGSHLHKAWELAAAQGRLTPEAAAEWDGDAWLLFLQAHGIQQSEALDAVRARAESAGWSKPWSLAALAGRPQLCEVLLHLAEERKA